METKKIIVIQSCYNKSGMQEYANIFRKGYGNLSDSAVLFAENHWKIFLNLSLLRYNEKMKFLVERFKYYEILHITDNAIFDFILINLFLKKTNCKIIYTLHDPKPHDENKIIRRLFRYVMIIKNNYLLNKAARTSNFFVHVHSKKLLFEKFKSSNSIIELPHPISLVNMDVRDIFKIQSKKEITISFVGRVEYYKGIDLFIKSIKDIDDLGIYNFNVIIAGRGKENVQIPKTKNIKINWLNKYLKNDEFDSIIKYSSLIVLPYREASASGVLTRVIPFDTPFICSDVGCMSQYFENGNNGILLKKLEDLTNEMIKFISGNYEFRHSFDYDSHPFSAKNISLNIFKQIKSEK